MFNKIRDILEFPFTPIASVVLMGVLDSALRSTGLTTLHFLVCLILTAATVISTLMNLAYYGKTMKIISLALCLVSALFMFSEFDGADARETVNTNSINTGYSTYNPGGYQTISFGGSEKKSASLFDDDCYVCNDSKKCHVCKGKGNFYCSGSYCLRGQCTSCKGTGLYDHGSYVSKCLTCKGDGICNICNGTNLRDCSTCHGSGRCTHCR